MAKHDWKLYLRLLYGAALLYLFYSFGLPPEIILLFALLFAGLILLRGPLERYLEKKLLGHFPSLERLPGWARRVIVILALIAVLYAFRLVLYFALGLAGIDLQQILYDAFYRQVQG